MCYYYSLSWLFTYNFFFFFITIRLYENLKIHTFSHSSFFNFLSLSLHHYSSFPFLSDSFLWKERKDSLFLLSFKSCLEVRRLKINKKFHERQDSSTDIVMNLLLVTSRWTFPGKREREREREKVRVLLIAILSLSLSSPFATFSFHFLLFVFLLLSSF